MGLTTEIGKNFTFLHRPVHREKVTLAHLIVHEVIALVARTDEAAICVGAIVT